MGEERESSTCNLVEVQARHLLGLTEETHVTPRGLAGVKPRFEPDPSRMRVKTFKVTPRDVHIMHYCTKTIQMITLLCLIAIAEHPTFLIVCHLLYVCLSIHEDNKRIIDVFWDSVSCGCS
jgi:hypothetical protein